MRVDTIEQAIMREAGSDDIGPEGYAVAIEIAKDNLKNGLCVVADSVNPVQITRDLWAEAAHKTNTNLCQIEIICSDTAEHRRRVEARAPEIENHKLPTWEDVENRDYEEWDNVDITIDTGKKTSDESKRFLLSALPKT